jgi:hypothetical protein
MAGHVYIIRGDLRLLACDAWLMPCSRNAQPQNHWFLESYRGSRQGSHFDELGGRRVQPLPGWPEGHPWPWLTQIGASRKPVEWFVAGATEFLDAAAAAITQAARPPMFGRAKSLLALPIVGTGLGGAAQRAGEVVQALLPELESFVGRQFAGAREFDVALVCWDAPNYAAAQAERVRRGSWPNDLTEPLRREAQKLAQRALQGELALFLGAGVSMAAGLPGWSGLLQGLAKQANLSPAENQALARIRSALDQATIVERRLQDQNVRLGSAIKSLLGNTSYYAVAHALLAALPVREVITTNYDQLFDNAWKGADPGGLSILPGAMKPNTRRWLLKMHGCLSDPERIVLTRANYARYDEQLPALTGIIQAFLITRHMLFVGFSLTDDNFHRIVDAVRRLRSSTSASDRFGTTLTLGHGGLAEALWDRDLQHVRMDEREESTDGSFPVSEAARRLEIFLDYLLASTRDTAHLLVGSRFDGVLSPGERQLRDALSRFVHEFSDNEVRALRSTVAWRQVERLLVSLGLDPKARWPE